MLRTENVAVGLYLVRGTVACRVPQGSSVGRPGERKLTIAKMINSDDVSME